MHLHMYEQVLNALNLLKNLLKIQADFIFTSAVIQIKWLNKIKKNGFYWCMSCHFWIIWNVRTVISSMIFIVIFCVCVFSHSHLVDCLTGALTRAFITSELIFFPLVTFHSYSFDSANTWHIKYIGFYHHLVCSYRFSTNFIIFASET